VSVFPGKGDGTFGTPKTYAVGALLRFVVATDIDGDGELDLAVSSNATDSIAVLKGRGDGTFGSAVVFATGGTPNDLRAADFNGDGKVDLAVANFGGGTVSILLNQSVQPSGVVIEFYNNILDNYFITADPNEQKAVAGGAAGPGWGATGNEFNAGGPLKVCRFYGSLSPGPNSHFYTIDAAECQALKTLQATNPASLPRWNFESNDFSSSASAAGQCAGDLIPVYRAYNNGNSRGIDSNHRITSNLASYQAQIAKGWRGEGVVMCAPAS
jgi:FG-GAP-like repeat